MAVFQCEKCGNWYADVTVGPDEWEPVFSSHGKGMAHSHFGHHSATDSERDSALFVRLAKAALARASLNLAAFTTAEAVKEALDEAEKAYREAKAQSDRSSEMLRLADAFALPGRDDGLWVNEAGLRELVETSRRPRSDLEDIRRSVKNTQAQVSEGQRLFAEATIALEVLRTKATAWTAVIPVGVTQASVERPIKNKAKHSPSPAQLAALQRAREARRARQLAPASV